MSWRASLPDDAGTMIRAVTFDAYGTLLRNDDLVHVARRIVDDHGLHVPVEDVYRRWIDLY